MREKRATAKKKRVNYYPFGLKHKGYNGNYKPLGNSTAQKFKYNGVEFEEALGLNLYEMKYRHYDPSIGRWLLIDPRVESLYSLTPYNAFLNDPIRYSDPEGDIPPQLIAGLVGATWEYGAQVYDNYQKGNMGYDAWVGNVDFADVLTEGVATGVTMGLNKVPGANTVTGVATEFVKSAIDVKGSLDVSVIGVSDNKKVSSVLKETAENATVGALAGKAGGLILGKAKTQAQKFVKKATSNKTAAYKRLTKTNNILKNGNKNAKKRNRGSSRSSRFNDAVKADRTSQVSKAVNKAVNSTSADKAVGQITGRSTKSAWQKVKSWWNGL